jgi:LEA14-like dessication related protein
MNKMMPILCGLLLVILAGCASLMVNFEEPQVSLTSFRVLPGNAIVPTFEIGLHITNPNRSVLKLGGVSYNVELEGYRIISGVSNELPQIEAYGEGDLLLEARPDLINTINLFTQLINGSRDSFGFKLEAQLDVGTLLPKIRVEKSGQISFAAWQKK